MALGIKKGDTVRLMAGNQTQDKNRSLTGTVLAVYPKKGTALVEGMNIIKKAQRQRSQEQPGGIIEQEAPIPLSRLRLVDPKSGKAGRFGTEIDEKGNKIRVLKTRSEDGNKIIV